jgi:hypothetical protein
VEAWHLNKRDLKKYPHFDPPISVEQAEKYATDANCVARHAFYPFVLYRQEWKKFAKKHADGKLKTRPIRYAARRDAYIFAYYRHVLSQHYETELARLGLDTAILAYRRIPTGDSKGGKCNIHFARDAFLKIRELGNCCVIGLDVSSYFESLDHTRLKAQWCKLLGATTLPADHFAVFKAITKHAMVDKKSLYERLGHFGEKAVIAGKSIKGYTTPFRLMPKRLCRGKKFRELIARHGDQKSIIETNYKPYGIPQGAPISDLLANLYLLDFDTTVAGWVRQLGGAYYRYSDDILIVVPGSEAVGRDLMAQTRGLIAKFGSKLEIKESKSSLFVFEQNGTDQNFQLLHGTQGKNGLEYLGFRYDGKHVYLRDATISNLRRKVARAAYRDADACARRYPDKDASKLKTFFNYERLIKQFGKVEDFDGQESDYRSWTFWTYASRASKIFGELGKTILRQLRKHRDLIRWRADRALELAVIRRDRRVARRPATK